MAKFVHGSAAQRTVIISRVIGRLARLSGLHQVAYRGIGLSHSIWDRVRKAAGLPVQPRSPQWLSATAGLDNRGFLRSWTQRRYEGGPKIIVLAIGSVGDILQITPVLRVLREISPTAEISLLHRSPAARAVLHGNMNVDSITTASAYHFEAVTRAVRDHGAADLVVNIASISYILTYTPAPLTRRHPDLCAVLPESFFAAAAAAQAKWARYPPVYPRREAAYTWPAEWQAFHYLDILGTTGNLPIDRHSALDFVTGPGDAAAGEIFDPARLYITVQSGIDAAVKNWARIAGRQPTKLLSPATWQETVALLKAAGVAVVQLGAGDDDPIAGVDVDLRGTTTLRQAAIILRGAACHVGTEGGLVHLARAMNVRSVVAFGPTSRQFLGYPANVNLVADDCTACWWTTKDWFIRCPRGFTVPPCMDAYTASMIVQATLAVIGAGDAGHAPPRPTELLPRQRLRAV